MMMMMMSTSATHSAPAECSGEMRDKSVRLLESKLRTHVEAVEEEASIFEASGDDATAYKKAIREAASKPRCDAHAAMVAQQKVEDSAPVVVAQGLFPCFRCKSMLTKHTEQQTRSADEPMTVTIKCLEPKCGASRKFNP